MKATARSERQSKQVGLLFREARDRKGLTQRDLADILHVTPAAVSVWEKGTSLPKSDKWDAISAALNLRIGTLDGRVVIQPPRLPVAAVAQRRPAGRAKLPATPAPKANTARGRRVPVLVSPSEMRLLEGHRHATRGVRAEVARALAI